MLSAPLVARDGTDFGLIEVAGKPDGPFTAGDELTLEDLARIGSLAIENARLEERERHIARTLQASLLPLTLPEIEGLDVAARYLAGGEGTVVGGDLYDLFEVDDEWAFVVGDVCGKGAEAAALTSMVRYTIRAEAVHRAGPGEVLGQLNDAILRQFDDGRFCTVLHGRVRMGRSGAQLAIACAGHPPPLVLTATGSVEPVPCGGRLLGVVPEVVPDDRARDAARRATRWCASPTASPRAAAAAACSATARCSGCCRARAGRDADGIAETVTRAALDFQGGRTQDDLALLVLRVPGT